MEQHLLPFFDERKTPVNTLMFHCSAQHTAQMIETLKSLELSCHYIIDTDGKMTNLVSEDKRAWHAGLGSWRENETDMNSHAIGIELCSPSLGQESYPQAQIESLISLSRQIITRHAIRPQYVIGHSDAAPTRKADPGKNFPWAYLAEHKIGLWYDLQEAKSAPTSNIKTLLSAIGYNTITPENFIASQYAFARHFIPHLVSVDKDIAHLVDNVYPPNLDFSSSEEFITVAQAVYMRFQA